MEQMTFMPQLLSAYFSADSVWKDENLQIRTTWKNQGGAAAFAGKICLDFEFINHRRIRYTYDDLHFSFSPHPQCCHWSLGEVCTVGGSYPVPAMWGGSRRVYLTLQDDDGRQLPFIGENGQVVQRQCLGQIEFAWGRPVDAVIAKIRPVNIVFCEDTGSTAAQEPALIEVGKAAFCRDYPGLYSFDGEKLGGKPVRLVLRDVQESRCFGVVDFACTAVPCEDGVRYHLDSHGCSLELVYRIRDDEVILTLENGADTAQTELIAADIPHLLSLGGEHNYLVDFNATGRRIDAHKTLTMSCEFPFDVDNFAGAYNENTCVALSASSLDTVLCHSIEGTQDAPRAVLGARLHYKVASEQKQGLSLPVKAQISLRLRFAAGGDWQTVAKLLRRDLTPCYDPIYRNTFVHKWMLDNGAGVQSPLDEFRTHIGALAELTDHLPQIVYLVGWQEGGHDWGYPVPGGLSSSIGSEEELRELIREFRERYNVCVSFHDNFDDAYLDYDYDHALIARDQYGQPYKGWMWSGGQSYIMSPKHYVLSGAMAARVKRQVERFDLKGSYHIDVLTSENRRYDYSPDVMAAADENFAYKKAIFDEFAGYGVDVTSEVLAVPMIGKMSYTWHIRAGGDPVQEGVEAIPLTPLLYHGAAGYNLPSDCSERNLLRAMMYGAQSVLGDLTGALTPEELRAAYILSIPVRQFAAREIERYEFDGSAVRAVYGPDSFIEVDMEHNTYTMQLDGRVLGKDWVTMLQTAPDTCLLYACDGGGYAFDLPEGWEKVKAVTLTQTGAGDAVEVRTDGGKLHLTLTSGVPVKVTKA